MRSKILVGASAFMDSLREEARSVEESLYVQAMTFEGDRAGDELMEILLSAGAKDVRLLVDSYSKAVINDRFVFGPYYLKDAAFRKEIAATRELVKKAEKAGIQVRYTNPMGPLMARYPLRNHKKLVVFDGKTAYLGGINFSQHNFAWHDMMIGIEDAGLAGCLKQDFLKSWDSQNQSQHYKFENSSLYFFNGIKSRSLYRRFFEQIKNARQTIQIISPYLSDPLLSQLKVAATKGVDVQVIAPAENNKSIFKKLLLAELKSNYFRLFHYPGMSHLKAILVDGQILIFGSSNYDLVSYYFEQEVVFISRNEELVNSFTREILQPALAESDEQVWNGQSAWPLRFLLSALKIFCKTASTTVLRPN